MGIRLAQEYFYDVIELLRGDFPAINLITTLYHVSLRDSYTYPTLVHTYDVMLECTCV